MISTDGPIQRRVREYYTARVTEFGPTAKGVDWSTEDSQLLRFTQLLRIVPHDTTPFSLIDYGCGYAALFDYLRASDARITSYQGYDLSSAMLSHAAARLGSNPLVSLCDSPDQLRSAEYTVASGVFNVRLDTAMPAWETYISDCLTTIAALSTRGFAFNLLTHFADPHRMRDDLYYADPLHWFEFCRMNFGRRVALLHDYPLFEFTIHVRLDQVAA